MNKKIMLLLFLIVTLVFSVALTSCMEGLSIPGVTDNTGGNTNNGGGTNNENGGNEDDDKPIDDGKTNINTVSFRHDGKTVYSVELAVGEGLKESEVKAAIAELGYDFNEYSSKSDYSTEFDFSSEITSDIKVFCRKVYVANYYYGSRVILTQKVDARSKYFSQEQYDEALALRYEGIAFTGYYNTDDVDADIQGTETAEQAAQKFDFKAELTDSVNIYCKIFYTVAYKYEGSTLFRQKVDSVKGFSAKQIERATEYLHHGYHFSGFYTDESLAPEYELDFGSVPTGNWTVYCERDKTKAGRDVTWRIENDNTTLIFEGSGDMYEFMQYDTDVPWRPFHSTVTEVQIEEGITSIADCAFYGFTKLTDITLPDGIVHIGNRAFYQSAIVNINFPASVRSIGEHAFNGCTGIVHLNFNQGLENIKQGAFYDCTSIETVVLTDQLMRFGSSAFKNCTSISSAYYIGTEEQYNNIEIGLDNFWIDELAHTYFISETKPTEPGPYWYYDAEGNICQWYYTIWYLASNGIKVPFLVDYVDVEVGITAENINTMSGIVFEGYKFDHWKEVKTETEYTMTAGTVLTEDLKLIGDRGDLCGDNLKWSVRNNILTISKINSSLDDGVMWDFENLKSSPWYKRAGSITKVIISSGVTHIGSYAFGDIMSKTSLYENFSYLDIPESVTSVHVNAFSGCGHLLYIYYAGSYTDLYGDADNSPKITGLTELVGIGSAVVYANATGVDYSTLGGGAYWSTVIGDGMIKRVAWVYDEETGALLVGGGDDSHVMINYTSHENTPWYSYRDNVTSVTINDNITTIGHHSFEGMSSVISIVAPRRVEKISGSAFVGTSYYNEMYNKGAVYVYTSANVDDTGVYGHLIKVNPEKAGATFVVAELTLSIAEQAFEGCSGITELVLPKDLKPNSIYSTAFSGLSGLTAFFYGGLEETWSSLTNTLTGEGEMLEGVQVYIYSATEPNDDTKLWWHWNDDYTTPVKW